MSRRRLTKGEQELWQKVAKSASPLAPTKKLFETQLTSKPERMRTKPDPVDLGPFRIGQKSVSERPAHYLAPDISQEVSAAPLRMDKKVHTKMRRGQLRPEARIDLHGMTLDQAHPALTRFVMTAHAQGKRLVLVITGKGKQSDDFGPIPVRRGLLRHNVPGWLSAPPLSSLVVQVAQAHVKHGGGGAYYVYLRRQK